MRGPGRVWDEWFFTPRSPVDLGVCRVLFFAYVFWNFGTRSFDDWAAVPDGFWMPTPLFRWLDPGALGAPLLVALQWTWRAALLASCVGIFTRLSTWTAFLVGFFLLGLPHNFGKVHHNDALLVFVMGFLACSHAGHAFSLDAWLGRRDGPRAPSWEYAWPVRAAATMILVVYFGAGIAKLRASGLSWVTSDNMENLLLFHYYTGHHPPVSWGKVLARIPGVPNAIAGLSLAFELAAPLAILSKKARVVLVPSLFLMQLGIWLLLGILFREFLFLYVFWVPWSRWIPPLGRMAAAGSPA